MTVLVHATNAAKRFGVVSFLLRLTEAAKDQNEFQKRIRAPMPIATTQATM